MKYNYKIPKLKGGASNNAPAANAPAANAPAGNAAAGNAPAGNAAAGNAPAGNAPAGNAPAANAPAANAPAANAPAANAGNNNAGNNKAAAANAGNNNNSGSTLARNVTSGMTKVLGRASNLSSNVLGKAENLMDTGKSQVGKIYTANVPYYADSITKFIVMILLLAVAYVILVFLRYLMVRFYRSRHQSTEIFSETKDSKHSFNISGNMIARSENQDGMEFTYSFWICLMGLKYNQGEWKHIMHKGSPTSYPNRAPGVWFHPVKNSIRVYMNSFDDILKHVDIDDIPVKKWVNIQLVLQNINSHTDTDENIVEIDNNQVLDIYVNGQNKKTMVFDSVPRQNNGDIYLNLFGGFDGYMSRVKYFPNAIDFEQTGKLVKEGPSTLPTGSGEIPPYLNDNWWFDFNPNTVY